MPDDPSPALTPARAVGWLGLGVLLALGALWTARPAGSGWTWRVAFVALSLGAAAALVALLRQRTPTARQVLVGAVVLRLAVFPMLPSLSDDGYRYLWDGLVAAEADVSPYALRPSDSGLARWQDRTEYARMNSPDYYSVYPPLSQWAFRVAATVGADDWRVGWLALKALLVLAEMGGVVALVVAVGPRAAAWYAWHPLAVVEVAGQGHTEGLVVGSLGLVLVAARSRLPLASIGATLGGLVKLYPFGLLPAAWRRDRAAGVVATFALTLLLTLPLAAPGALTNAAESLGLFFGTFDAYAGPYRALKAALYPALGDWSGRAASAALTGAAALAVLVATVRDDGSEDALRRVLAVLVVGVYLGGATLHPWYAVPVLFVLPLLKHKNWLAWMATIATAGYLEYEIPNAGLPVLVVGWGGGLALWIASRRPRGDRP